jgi:hypothetical protein
VLNFIIEQTDNISTTIESNQKEFKPLLERLIDRGDPMVVVVNDSLKVTEINMQNTNEGVAHTTFQAKSIASCHGEDSCDKHQTKLPFKIEGENLIFKIKLPPAWIFNY